MRVKPFARLVLMIALLLPTMTPLVAYAAESPAALNARETGVGLYLRQDTLTDRIATLEKGEALVPIAESIGTEIWYMVRTKQGLTGWVRGADVIVSKETKQSLGDEKSASSTWSAHTSEGRTFSGTWSLAPNSTSDTASGAWTLNGTDGVAMMRGTWSAAKHSTGWNGVWRATIEGRQTEYTGSWSAELSYMRNAPFAELFEAAAKQAISGLWTGPSQSGTWSIHTAK